MYCLFEGKKMFVSDIPYALDSYRFGAHQPNQAILLKLGMHIMETIDLTDFFTKLFELPNFLDEIINYNNSLDVDPDWISNTLQTKFWKSKVEKLNLKDDEVALPLFVYFDEFQPLNAFGSHSSAYKLSGIYMSIPCLPPSVQSQLKYIFLAMLFFACDRSIYGNKKIFAPLIDQLNKLQSDGIKLRHKKYATLMLLPILFIGDNLGLNSILGFSEGFNAIYYCRFCKSSKEVMQKLFIEDPKAHEKCTKL